MTDANVTLSDLAKLQNDFKRKAAEHGKSAVLSSLKQFFADHSEIAAVRWRQYTPYFNDGDPCEFTVHDLEYRFGEAPELPEGEDAGNEDEEEYDEDENEDEDEQWRDLWSTSSGHFLSPETDEALNALNKQLSECEEVLQFAFGDHAEITVTPDEVTIDDVDHD